MGSSETGTIRMATLLAARRPGWSLAQAFYTDAEFFAHDLAGIFYRHWLFAGLECELAEPGAYLRVDVGPSAVIVVRDQAGALHAFHNVCRHRGSALCDAPRGTVRSFVCPYHQWTYDLAGRVTSTPQMHDGFDPTGFDLRPVALERIAGALFICLAETPPDIAPFRAALEPALAPHGLAEARLADSYDLTVRGNWKLVMENSRECDHCPASHPELMRTFLHSYDFRNPTAHAEIAQFWQDCEARGLPSALAQGDNYRVNRLPFVRDARSITLDGEPVTARRLGALPDLPIGSLRFVQFPSLFAHALADYAVFVRLLPIGPRETRVTTSFVVAREAVEGRDYTLDHLTRVWIDTNEQDRVLIERNQRGVDSVGYQSGPYAEVGEYGVIAFTDWYCRAMQEHLGEKMR